MGSYFVYVRPSLRTHSTTMTDRRTEVHGKYGQTSPLLLLAVWATRIKDSRPSPQLVTCRNQIYMHSMLGIRGWAVHSLQATR